MGVIILLYTEPANLRYMPLKHHLALQSFTLNAEIDIATTKLNKSTGANMYVLFGYRCVPLSQKTLNQTAIKVNMATRHLYF
jgi:hypothetical protein